MRPILFEIGDFAIPSFWAMALLGFVLAGNAKGAAFIAGFHAAAIAACVLALLAGLSAFALVGGAADAGAGGTAGRRPKRRTR